MWLFIALLLLGASAGVVCVGHTFVDANGNGVQESFELNAQGIALTNSDGSTAVSNAQGNYVLTFVNASAPNNTYTVTVPEGGILTTPGGATRPALVPTNGSACVLAPTGLANVPSTVLTTTQMVSAAVFGGLLGLVWAAGVGFVIYYRCYRRRLHRA
jgi:hypothetical protein